MRVSPGSKLTRSKWSIGRATSIPYGHPSSIRTSPTSASSLSARTDREAAAYRKSRTCLGSRNLWRRWSALPDPKTGSNSRRRLRFLGSWLSGSSKTLVNLSPFPQIY